jgi:hypothetical protein
MQPLFKIPNQTTPKAAFSWRDGERFFTMQPNRSAGHLQSTEADVLTWNSPDGGRLAIGVIIPCPKCAFPIMVKADNSVLDVDGDGRLSYRAIVSCSGHWSVKDDFGISLLSRDGRPQRERCGWQSVIIDGRAHNPRCPGLREGTCQCGQEIDHFEAESIARGHS